MSRAKRNQHDPRQQPLPTWVTGMIREEVDLLDAIQLPPLPQRISRRNNVTGNNNTIPDLFDNNNTSGSQNDPTTVHSSGSSNTINDPTNTINDPTNTINNPTNDTARSMDTTTSAPITPANTVIATFGTSNTNTVPTNTFTNAISNISTYKESFIHQLLGTQGRVTNPISNNPIYIPKVGFMEHWDFRT